MLEGVLAQPLQFALAVKETVPDVFDFFSKFFYLFVEFFQIFGPTYFLALKQANRSSRQAEFSTRYFSTFRYKRVVVICRNGPDVAFVDVYFVQNVRHEFRIFRIELNDLRGRKRIRVHLDGCGMKLFKSIQDKKVCLALACVTQNIDGLIRFGLVIDNIIVEIGFQVILDGDFVVFTGG